MRCDWCGQEFDEGETVVAMRIGDAQFFPQAGVLRFSHHINKDSDLENLYHPFCAIEYLTGEFPE